MGRLDGSAGGVPAGDRRLPETAAPRLAGGGAASRPGGYFKVDKKFTRRRDRDGEGVHVLTAPWQRHDSLIPADHEFDWIPVHLGFVGQDAARQPYQYR